MKRYPITSYALFCVMFGLVAFFIADLGTYDDGSVGGLGFGLVLVWSVIAFPFSVPMEILGPSGTGNLVGAVLGFLIFVGVEVVVRKLRYGKWHLTNH